MSVHTNRNIIRRQQDFVLDRKLVSIHSEDRDIRKWPTSSQFEIDLPQPIENVQSLRLVQCNFPVNYYTFSQSNQNTKMSFRVLPKDPQDPYYTILHFAYMNKVIFQIEIQEGTYSAEELARELEHKMNEAMETYISELEPELEEYSRFRVYHHSVEHKFWFANEKDEFSLLFDHREEYNIRCSTPIWFNYINWGLGSYLGFDRTTYTSSPLVNKKGSNIPLKFTHQKEELMEVGEDPIQVLKAIFSPNLIGDQVFYMELDKFNSYDEIKPYSHSTNNSLGNDYNGVVDSAFAKIPILSEPYGKQSDSRSLFLQNISHYDPCIKKITKLKFRFRYHDGRLVDFRNNQFSFTIEFNQLHNEMSRKYNLRIPATYQL